jgi:ribosome biogenesis GTPase A
MDLWLGNRKRILVLNREDMISTADRNAWAEYFTRRGTKVVFSNGQLGMVSKQNLFSSISPCSEVSCSTYLILCFMYRAQ